jgi:hypothetical protein
MASQENLRIALLGALGFIALELTTAYYGIGSVAATFCGPVFIGAILLYNAYAAWKPRRIIFSPTYQRQAKGVALVCLATGLVFATGAMNGSLVLGSVGFTEFQGIGAFLWLLIVFYWVDDSIIAGRRADPLARDTGNWSKIRLPYWIAIIGAVTAASALGLYFYAVGNTAAIIGPPPPTVNPFFFALVAIINNAPQVLAFGSGLVLLPIVAKRAKDVVLRRHLIWFGIFALVFISTTLIAAVTTLFLPPNVIFCPPGFVSQGAACVRAALPPHVLEVENIGNALVYLTDFIGAYCLSKSVRSLVPFTEIQLSEGGEFIQT